MDHDSLPSTFQVTWRSHPDPTALPFSRDDPPFHLTPVDWEQLSLRDAEFVPHTWTELEQLIAAGHLDQLKRWPSQLKAYLAWTKHVKLKYGSATQYLLDQRLCWKSVGEAGELRFVVNHRVPCTDAEDYRILRNDWPYAVTQDIRHIVVWSKLPLPVDDAGALTLEGKMLVEDFIARVFREPAGEGSGGVEIGSRVQWFKNATGLQSVRSLEHLHVLVRGVDEALLQRWMV